MDKDSFAQAKAFIYSDITREISLAANGGSAGNFLCALGLLCYTEFAGGVDRGTFAQGQSRRNFEHFFALLGPHYKQLLRSHDIYDFFRNGLVHESGVKRDCNISIFTTVGKKDVGVDYDSSSNRYVFRVKGYFEDFKNAFDALEKRRFP